MSKNTREFASMAERRRFEALQARKAPAPSAGAMRAADKVLAYAPRTPFSGKTSEREREQAELASLIDRESGLGEAVAALRDARLWLNEFMEGKASNDWPAEAVERKLGEVLAKIEGRE